MNELTMNELLDVNGGGLTLAEALIYGAAIALSTSCPPALAVTAVGIAFIEYQDYKDSV